MSYVEYVNFSPSIASTAALLLTFLEAKARVPSGVKATAETCSPIATVSTTLTSCPWMERTVMELSALLATSARLPARLIAIPEGCLPPLTVAISAGGFALRSITNMSLPGELFHAPPSWTQSIELATRARLPSGVMARFVGGPYTEFISGRLPMSRGFSRSPMSSTSTASLPGGDKTALPSASQNTLLSTPTITYWAQAGAPHTPRHKAKPALNARIDLRIFFMALSSGCRTGLPHIMLVPRLGWRPDTESPSLDTRRRPNVV